MDVIIAFVESMSSINVVLITSSITIVGVVLGCLFSMRAMKTLQMEKENVKNEDKNQTCDESKEILERGEDESSSAEEKKVKWSTDCPDIPSDKTMKSDADPVDFCNHIQREVRKTEQRMAREELEEKMSAQDKEKEQRIQREQLQAIFSLMESQHDKFGLNSMAEIKEQMKLYTN